jgi:large subunit ribosomal protein L10
MKDKDQKKKDLESLHSDLEKAKHVFLTGYEKMTVQQDFELRKAVRAAGGNYKVVKNNIAEKASEGTPADQLMRDLAGMTSMAYTSGDPVALAKALTIYAKAVPAFTFKAGMVEGRVIDIKQVQELASMPSRDQLLAKVLFLINASSQRLVTAISGVGRNLAIVLDQAAKENKFTAE